MSTLQEMKQKLVQRLERRSEPRTFAERQVILVWNGAQHSVASVTALDWSNAGLRIRHNLPLHRSEPVTVVTPEWIAVAKVVWIIESEDGKETGLLFTERRPSPFEG